MNWQSLYLLALAALLSSCQMGIEMEGGILAPDISAEFESQPQTKTSLSTDESGVGTIYWTPADQIDVFFGTKKARYTSQNNAEAKTAVFKTNDYLGSTEVFSSDIWGLYPSNSTSTCDGSSITTTLPSQQLGVPNTFDDDLFISVAHSASTSLQFYNVCGGIKFSMVYDDIASVTFRGNNNEALAGEISISFQDGLPKATIVNGVKEITLTPKTGSSFINGEDYYITLLPGTLSSGFTMTFIATDGTTGVLNYTDKSVTIKRSVFSKKSNMDIYAFFDDERQPNNVIYYTSVDGKIVTPNVTDVFGANIVSNEYVNGVGIISFDGDVVSVGESAFYECTNLVSINLGTSIYTIGSDAFYGCTSLSDINIPDSVLSIGDNAFSECENIVIGANVSSISAKAFSPAHIQTLVVSERNETYDSRNNCNSLIETASNTLICGGRNSIIPEGIEIIGEEAFLDSGMETIVIPSSVVLIKERAFSLYNVFKTVYCYANTPPTLEFMSFFDYWHPFFTSYMLSYETTIYVPSNSYQDYVNEWGDLRSITIKKMELIPEAVDLGLPSGLKWASFNVGASAPEEYGDYFAWGETEPKSIYDWSTYKWCNGSRTSLTKYNTKSNFGVVDNKTVLDAADDAACANLGDKWRMPTDVEWEELISQCTWTWTTRNGVNGMLATGKSGNSIFLPAAGGRWYSNGLSNDGSYGHYWSSSITDLPDQAWYVSFGSEEASRSVQIRNIGLSVRPVLDDRIHPESVTFNKTSLSLNVGSSAQLTATVSPTNVTSKAVIWSSSDTSVATVSSDGIVTAKAIGTATITVSTVDGGKTATCTVTVRSQDYTPEAVDLGLPSGLKWASYNVGASAPEEYGDYYAWGETETKDDYNWSTYKWCNGSSISLTKYNTKSDYGSVDNKTILEAEDDVAHVKLGAMWRMPTYADWGELRTKCTWTWTTRNGVNGMFITGKNGNSIFLPASGYRNGAVLHYAGSHGYYWYSSLSTSGSSNAWYALFNSEGVYLSNNYRCYGQSVRPVTE